MVPPFTAELDVPAVTVPDAIVLPIDVEEVETELVEIMVVVICPVVVVDERVSFILEVVSNPVVVVAVVLVGATGVLLLDVELMLVAKSTLVGLSVVMSSVSIVSFGGFGLWHGGT